MLNLKLSRQFLLNKSRLVAGTTMLLLIIGALNACVSSSSYEDVSKERDELLKKQNALAGNTKLLRNKVESTEEQAARLKSELENTEQHALRLKSELQSTQTQLDEASESLEKKNVVLRRASQMLNDKNASLKSASDELTRRQEELLETEKMLAESNMKLQASDDYMEKTSKLYKDLVSELSSELTANQIKISEMKDGVTVNLSQDILFPSGSATLNKSGIDVIKKVSGTLKNIPHQIIVAGFTDNVPIKGELTKMFPTNWELAGARAASVVRLLENQGVDSNKLTAVSFGENKPVATNDDWKLRAQNRRIEIRLRPVE
ncbi:MAG: OmpA family protein [Gammaproteobacteria bacterium]|nr:OmpA family protein [Gammaproteobacteria bacterium]